jgi:hypothetical protein
MNTTVYHVLLRTSALTLALVLLFVSGIVSPITKEIAGNTQAYLATAIGMNAAVLPNEYNTLNAQLQERANELTSREVAVSLKEQRGANSDMSTFVLSTLLFVVLVLLILNYVLDYLRAREKKVNYVQNEKMA